MMRLWISAAVVSLLSVALVPASSGLRTAPPNIVLISVDTLRADAMGFQGNPDASTPALDRLASGGTIFEDALSVIGKTSPSFATMFTSLYPVSHGARRNGIRVDERLTLLPQHLRQAGYHTAAILSNWTLKGRLSGLDKGWDRYDTDFGKVRAGPVATERDAVDVSRLSIEAMTSRPAGRPMFLWAHYSEPHAPYVQHSDIGVGRPGRDDRDDGWKKRWRYASEVAYTDRAIGRLLVEIDQRLGRDGTMILFLADHGEALGDHGEWGHGMDCFEPNLRVPFVLAGTGIPAGRVTSTPVSLVDVMPTLLAAAGVPAPEGMTGVSWLDVREKPTPGTRERFMFADRGGVHGEHFTREHRDPLSMAIVRGGMKAIYEFRANRWRFFDLAADPGELNPLEKEPKAGGEPLEQSLAFWYGRLRRFSSREPVKISREDEEKLRTLGYIE